MLSRREWEPFLVPAEERARAGTSQGPLLVLEESWVARYNIAYDNVTNFLFYDTTRRVLEIAARVPTTPSEAERITEELNAFDHDDERYFCDWEGEDEQFISYTSRMLAGIERQLGCSRAEAVARFRSLVIQCFTSENGSYYRRGREIRRDGFQQGVAWWGAFLDNNHPRHDTTYPSGNLRQLEDEEFTSQFREGLYDDVDSYRWGRRAIFVALDYAASSESLDAYLRSGVLARVIDRENSLATSSSTTTTSTLSPAEITAAATTTTTTADPVATTTTTTAPAAAEAEAMAATTEAMAATTETTTTTTTRAPLYWEDAAELGEQIQFPVSN